MNGDDKKELISKFIIDNSVDVFMMTKVNVNWKIIGPLTRKWFKNRRTAAFIIFFLDQKHCTIVASNLSASVIRSYNDKRLMGRWCSTTIQGKKNNITRMVTVCIPCNSKTHRFKAVFSQQQAALLKSKIGKGLLKMFWLGFWKEVDEWYSNGVKLIIGGDWKRNVYNKQLKSEFQQRDMIPAITPQHTLRAPETYCDGSYHPIDKIYVSQELNIHTYKIKGTTNPYG